MLSLEGGAQPDIAGRGLHAPTVSPALHAPLIHKPARDCTMCIVMPPACVVCA